jgi:hypothetical protein
MPDPSDGFAAALAERYRVERELGRGGMTTVRAELAKLVGNP